MITITLDGREVQLVPTANAAIKLSEKYGGMLPLVDAINMGSIDAATDVIFRALDKKDGERDGLRALVYDAGLAYLTPHLVRFVLALMNGGKAVTGEAA